jgi:hypothetical protein
VIARFVDIGGIDDHHSLKKNRIYNKKWREYLVNLLHVINNIIRTKIE